jgi:spermidine synthase
LVSPRRYHRTILACLLVLLAARLPAAPRGGSLGFFGPVVYEVQSEFSQIRVRENGSIRTLSFVRDSGEEVVESQVNLRRREELLVPYTRYMFLSYVYQPAPRKVLIVGLGGGAMVHWLQAQDPDVAVDVVEIDPEVVSIADRYFDVRTEGNVRILTQDAFELFQTSEELYDVIYMDAFLKPSDATDSTGVPLALKTEEFYAQVQARLNPGGCVVFNLNSHQEVWDDVETIRGSFPQTDVYRLTTQHGLIPVASLGEQPLTQREIEQRAAAADRRLKANFSLKVLARGLYRQQ